MGNKEGNGYTIEGEIRNAPDSTLVVISNLEFSDSTIALNGKFSFAGSVDEPRRSLFSLNSKRRTAFWLENVRISVDGDYDNIEDAHIEGGENQKYFNLLWEQKKPIREKMDNYVSQIMGDSLDVNQKDSVRTLYDVLKNKLVHIDREFIRNYPNNLESALRLGVYRKIWDKDSLSVFFSLMNKKTQLSSHGRKIYDFLELPDNPKIGEQYVDMKQKNTDGDEVRLSQFLGTYTLIDFWASWCKPCRAENPNLVQLFEKYKDHGFSIVGVSQDMDKKAWVKAIESDGLPWVNLSDLAGPDSEIFLVYDVDFIPDNILLDQNGVVVARNLRGDSLKDTLKKLFHF